MALKRNDVKALAETLEAVLASIDAGELTASASTRLRLEGAIVALEAVLGDPSTLLDRLGPDSK